MRQADVILVPTIPECEALFAELIEIVIPKGIALVIWPRITPWHLTNANLG